MTDPRLPTKPGYYWAKWRIASDGTHEGDELTPSDKWEIVQVNANCTDWKTSEEGLSVSVCGVRETQWPMDFVWGDFICDLERSPTMIDLDAFKGFTPGPWSAGHFANDNHPCGCQCIFGNDDRMGAVATVHVRDGSDDDNPPAAEAAQNMLLIAAAPDLLALAREQRAELKMLRALIDDLRRGEEG